VNADALDHLRAADPVIGGLIDRYGEIDLVPGHRRGLDDYTALVRSIAGQQLSVRAAQTIYDRLLEFFGGHPPSPREIVDADPDAMRAAAGLSRAKTVFLRSLAEHVLDGSLRLESLHEASDEEVLRELTAVKGIGEWSAHMFLIFQLGRPDVLASGDLGIRRAVERAYALPGLPAASELSELAEPWRPYRTVACRYLWESLDNTPKV
jgi:DNA-3-methyladenine glycosylase II